MSECKHNLVWTGTRYICKFCEKPLLELYEEQDAEIDRLKEENLTLRHLRDELFDRNAALKKKVERALTYLDSKINGLSFPYFPHAYTDLKQILTEK